MSVAGRRPAIRRPVPTRTMSAVDMRKPVKMITLPDKYDLELSKMYPSKCWETENNDRFQGFPNVHQEGPQKPEFVITSLDTRKHKPQTSRFYHIKGVNKKPVCAVTQWPGASPSNDDKFSSTYTTSFPEKEIPVRKLIRRTNIEERCEGIVPCRLDETRFDIRTEMLLPVCDSTDIPCPRKKNPHKYMLRKRKVPPPYREELPGVASPACGIIYKALEVPRMERYSPEETPSGALPFENGSLLPMAPAPDRISVCSLSGLPFTRRRFIQPPPSWITSDKPQMPVSITSLQGKKFTRRKFIPNPQTNVEFGSDLNTSKKVSDETKEQENDKETQELEEEDVITT